MAEKKLLRHLAHGGSPDDETGVQLVYRFATKVWNDSTVKPVLREHGMTIEEVGLVYSSAIECLMPEPWMNVSGPMLVPTQWFMEPHRIENLLVEVTRSAGDASREEWLELLVEKACTLAVATKAAHDQEYGKPNVQVSDEGGIQSTRGCMIVILFWATLSALAAIAGSLALLVA